MLLKLKKTAAMVAGVALLLVTAGCGSDAEQITTVPVQGRVTWEGEPVTNGTVIFVPAGGGPPAEGVLDSAGNYQLTTAGNSGAVPGPHKVMITSSNGQDPSAMPEDEPDIIESPLPPEYGISSETSGLTATVSETGENQIDFHLPLQQE